MAFTAMKPDARIVIFSLAGNAPGVAIGLLPRIAVKGSVMTNARRHIVHKSAE
jgi:hypothetical protein